MPHHRPALFVFSWIDVIAICLCCLFGMFALQLIGVYLAGLAYYPKSDQMDIANLITQGSQNGVVVALSVIFTALVFTLLSLLFVFLKFKKSNNTHNIHTWQAMKYFFGIKPPTLAGIIISLINLIIFMVISEILTVIADKSPMDFLDGLINQQSQLLLIFAIIIIAPIYEELVFRGLIFGAISYQASLDVTPICLFGHVYIKKNTLMATLISSMLFTLVHLQYDLFGMILIFGMALLFCFVRVKYGLITATLMHIINNGVAMVFYLATNP